MSRVRIELNPRLEEQLLREPGLIEALRRAADVAAETARAACPRSASEGEHLADTIEGVVGEGDDGRIVVRVIARKYNAYFVEFGTVDQPPRPYLRPAGEATFERFAAAHNVVNE